MCLISYVVLVDVSNKSSFYVLFSCNILQVCCMFSFILVMSCNFFANIMMHVICIFCCFTWCIKSIFSSCNLQLFNVMSSTLLYNLLWHLFTNQSVCHLHLMSFYRASSIHVFLHYGTFWSMSYFFLAIVLQLFFQILRCVSSHILLFY